MSAHEDAGPIFRQAMGPVARELLGEEPTTETNDELKFGTRGSLVIDLRKGCWHDFEAGCGGGVLDFVMARRSVDKASALTWMREHKHLPPAEASGIVARYPYIDTDGVLLFEVVRLEPKSFRQRRPDGAGGWVWNMQGVQRVLYRLPAVIAAVASGQTVFVVEGEKAAEALARIGMAATCSPGGAGKWRDSYSTDLAGADVVILPDNDAPGRAHADQVAASLRKLARPPTIRVLPLPGLLEKGDVVDWLGMGGTADALRQLVADAAVPPAEGPQSSAAPKPQRPRREDRPAGDGPAICIEAGELHTMADAAEAAIVAAGVAIYQRGNSMVRPVAQVAAASHGRTTLAAGLAEVTIPVLVDVLSTVSRWEKYDARAKRGVRANPPRQVAEIVLSRAGFWSVPVVVGVATTPTMRPDGTIVSAPGYDAATRLYHAADPGLILHRTAHNPTRADAEAALALLNGLLAGFPLVDGVARAVALSALITPIIRGAIPAAPMHLFRAPTAGSGKSYLADVVSVILTGRLCPVITASPNEEETEKRLVGLLLAGFPLVSIDNVNGELGGDLLCQAIERQFIRVRPLGRSDIIEIESRATVLATGNNARVRGDMVRRTLIADLDAGVERPELREFPTDPVATIQADRSSYVSACLIIVRAYLLAGQPDRLSPIASFSQWSDLVRSALVWLGCADPAQSMEQAREDDPELGELREVLDAWREAFGTSAVTVRQAIDTATTPVPQADEYGEVPSYGATTALPYPALKDALERVAGVRGGIDARRFGYWLNARKNRPVGAYSFRRGADNRDSLATWRAWSAGR